MIAKWITLAIVLVFFIVGCSASDSSPAPTPNATATIEAVAQATAQVTWVESYTFRAPAGTYNERGASSELECSEIEYLDTLGSGYRADVDQRYILMKVKVRNLSSLEPILIPLHIFSLIGADGQVIEPDNVSYSLTNSLDLTSLDRGTYAEGSIVFLASKDFVPSRLKFDGYPDSAQVSAVIIDPKAPVPSHLLEIYGSPDAYAHLKTMLNWDESSSKFMTDMMSGLSQYDFGSVDQMYSVAIPYSSLEYVSDSIRKANAPAVFTGIQERWLEVAKHIDKIRQYARPMYVEKGSSDRRITYTEFQDLKEKLRAEISETEAILSELRSEMRAYLP